MPSMPSTPSAEHRNTSSADDTDKTTTSAGEPSPAAPPPHSSPSTSPGPHHPEHPRKQPLMNLALWCGILAIPLSISIVLVVIIGDVISEDNPLSWVPGALTNLAPVVLVIGVLAFVRAHELLPRVHTLATAATAIASFLLGAAAQASWTVGFEAALQALKPPTPSPTQLDREQNHDTPLIARRSDRECTLPSEEPSPTPSTAVHHMNGGFSLPARIHLQTGR